MLFRLSDINLINEKFGTDWSYWQREAVPMDNYFEKLDSEVVPSEKAYNGYKSAKLTEAQPLLSTQHKEEIRGNRFYYLSTYYFVESENRTSSRYKQYITPSFFNSTAGSARPFDINFKEVSNYDKWEYVSRIIRPSDYSGYSYYKDFSLTFYTQELNNAYVARPLVLDLSTLFEYTQIPSLDDLDAMFKLHTDKPLDKLIFDRTLTDIENRTAKGYNNLSDLQRILDWLRYLGDTKGLGLFITPLSFGERLTRDTMQGIIDYATEIKNAYPKADNEPSTPLPIAWDWIKANDLERILDIAWSFYYSSKIDKLYSGTFKAGNQIKFRGGFAV